MSNEMIKLSKSILEDIQKLRSEEIKDLIKYIENEEDLRLYKISKSAASNIRIEIGKMEGFELHLLKHNLEDALNCK